MFDEINIKDYLAPLRMLKGTITYTYYILDSATYSLADFYFTDISFVYLNEGVM